MPKYNNRYYPKPYHRSRYRSCSSSYSSHISPSYSPIPFRNPIPRHNFAISPSPSFNFPIEAKEHIPLKPSSSSKPPAPSLDVLLSKLSSSINLINEELSSLRELERYLKNMKESGKAKERCNSPSFGNDDVRPNLGELNADSFPLSVPQNGESLQECEERERNELEKVQSRVKKEQIDKTDHKLKSDKEHYKNEYKKKIIEREQKDRRKDKKREEKKREEKKREEKKRRKDEHKDREKKRDGLRFLEKKDKKRSWMKKEE